MTVVLRKPVPGAVPVHLVDRESFPALIGQQTPVTRRWLAACGFKGAPDSHALVPDEQGALREVWVGVHGAAHPWVLSALPRGLPEGRYRLGTEGLPPDPQAGSWMMP